jgi:hypothetical protein
VDEKKRSRFLHSCFGYPNKTMPREVERIRDQWEFIQAYDKNILYYLFIKQPRN